MREEEARTQAGAVQCREEERRLGLVEMCSGIRREDTRTKSEFVVISSWR